MYPEFTPHTLEDVYTTIALTLNREEITRAQPEEQNALVQKALRLQRTLLIMDNLESVQDERIKPFLRHLPAPTKAIITSREWLDVADIYPLTGLAWQESEALISNETNIRRVALSNQQKKRLFDLTSGLPLPIQLSIARLSSGESFRAVERWLGDATGQLPEYCIKGQIELAARNNPHTWDVLFICALSDRKAGIARNAIGNIADLSIADRDDTLAQLQRLYLVNPVRADRYGVFPIVQRYAEGQYKGNTPYQIIRRWLTWMLAFANRYGQNFFRDDHPARQFAVEYPNIRTAIFWCYERQNWHEVLLLCERSHQFLYFSGLFHELNEIIQIWLKAAEQVGNAEHQGVANLQSARLLTIWEKRDEAFDLLDRVEPLLENSVRSSDLAEAWMTRSQILKHRRQFDEAKRYAKKTQNLGSEIKDQDIELLGILQYADIENAMGNYDEAIKWIELAENIMASTPSSREHTAVLYRKARVLQHIGEYEEAKAILIDAVEVHSKSGSNRYLAFSQLRLGQVYQALGHKVEAYQAGKKALDLFERLGQRKYAEIAEGLLSELSGTSDQETTTLDGF